MKRDIERKLYCGVQKVGWGVGVDGGVDGGVGVGWGGGGCFCAF